MELIKLNGNLSNRIGLLEARENLFPRINNYGVDL
jgi:hypothetical protein